MSGPWARSRASAAHEGPLVLVVTHGGVVRALERHLFGEPPCWAIASS